MKKIYITLTLLLLTLFSFTGCGENSYDGKTGLYSSASANQSDVDVAVKSIYENNILNDINETYHDSLLLLNYLKDLNDSNSSEALSNARVAFKDLIYAYKRVETLYVAGYNSDDMLEIAEFNIEQYIKSSKSQDIVGDLDKVFAGNKAIVANALKGITALEYTLFGYDQSLREVHALMNQNRLDAALLMANNLVAQFKIIQNYYKNDATFLSSNDDAVGALLNVLVTSSYSLREIRIGDGAGYTTKYKNNPDPTRLEYYKSANSLEAIKEILKTHQSVMQNGLKDIAIAGNARSEANAIVVATQEALAICNSYNSTLANELVSSKTLELYETIRTLQNNYTALINGLNFTQKLLEADGD